MSAASHNQADMELDADPSNPIVTEDSYAAYSYDWGTGVFSGSCAINVTGGKIDDRVILDIKYHKQGTEPPMIMGKHQGNFVWGYELERLIGTGVVDIEDVFDLIKLELYEKTDTITENRRLALREQLERQNITFDDLVVEHLKAVDRESKDFVYSSVYRTGLTQEQLRNLPTRIRVGVPEMWSLKARARMQAAAQKAGMELVTLSSEPENALAYFLHRMAGMQQSIGSILRVNDRILVVDIGRGTLDIVVYVLEEPLTETSRLKAIDASSGGDCASQKINEYLLATLESGPQVQNEGQAALLGRLGFTNLKWRKEVMAHVEPLKCAFPHQTKYRFCLDPAEGKEQWFRFSKEEVQEAFDRVVAEVKEKIRDMVKKHDPALINLTGGLTKNSHVYQALVDEFQQGRTTVVSTTESDASPPVSRGGLLRHHTITAANLPSHYGYAIVQQEEFDGRVHRDGVVGVENGVRQVPVRDDLNVEQIDPGTGRRLMRDQVYKIYQPNTNVVFGSRYKRGVEFVYDRLGVVFKKGETIASDEPVAQEFSVDYYLDFENPTLTATLVYFDGQQKNHGPSGRKGEHSEEFGKGIYHFKTITKAINKELLEHHKVKIVEDQKVKGSKAYKVRCKVTVKYQNQIDMTMGWELKTTNNATIRLWEDDERVWDANFSPFVLQAGIERADGGAKGGDGDDGMEDVREENDSPEYEASEPDSGAGSPRVVVETHKGDGEMDFEDYGEKDSDDSDDDSDDDGGDDDGNENAMDLDQVPQVRRAPKRRAVAMVHSYEVRSE
ncbi:hypothetical protein LTR56_015838 [Elasticomyces elasticus]|nr:hypothetical protein LTR22_023037 [Elasticomyces elasticus]KAK3633423.1 hypothetical protein LTR56_015838 [Elasticomyces elasticus]KAK5747804.1 hypothetical protein LTS12_022159 [Elasticomyces elasticus]